MSAYQEVPDILIIGKYFTSLGWGVITDTYKALAILYLECFYVRNGLDYGG